MLKIKKNGNVGQRIMMKSKLNQKFNKTEFLK